MGAVEGVNTSDAERWSKIPDGMTYEEWKLGKDSENPINEQKQNAHIPGTREWERRVSSLDDGETLPSEIYGGVEDAQRLLDEYRGTGQAHFNWDKKGGVQAKETCVTADGVKIGVWRDKETKRELPTDSFTIHYSKTGSHIIPSRPSWLKGVQS